MRPRLCRLDALADHLCFEALNVVERSFNGVNVDEESGVVVFRRGVTLGAIVTRGRVELRLVDAWDWALALSGIFVFVTRCAVPWVQRAFEPGGCVTPCCGPTASGSGSLAKDHDLQRLNLYAYGREANRSGWRTLAAC